MIFGLMGPRRLDVLTRWCHTPTIIFHGSIQTGKGLGNWPGNDQSRSAPSARSPRGVAYRSTNLVCDRPTASGVPATTPVQRPRRTGSHATPAPARVKRAEGHARIAVAPVGSIRHATTDALQINDSAPFDGISYDVSTRSSSPMTATRHHEQTHRKRADGQSNS